MPQRFDIDLLSQRQAFPARLSQANDLFQPGRSGGLQMDSGVESAQGPPDDRVKRELVAAGMNAELECRRQPIAVAGMSQHREVLVELFLELGQVARSEEHT